MYSPQKRMELRYDPGIPLLGMYPQELKAGTQTRTCMPVSIAALFITLFTSFWWKQPKCPSTNDG